MNREAAKHCNEVGSGNGYQQIRSCKHFYGHLFTRATSDQAVTEAFEPLSNLKIAGRWLA